MQLQDVVEALARRIGRPVTLEDPAGALLAHSRHGPDVDAVRQRMILERQADPWAADFVRRHGIDTATDPVRSAGAPEHGMGPRVVVPVRLDAELVAWLWIVDPDMSLPDADVEDAVRTAALLADRMAEERAAAQRGRAERVERLRGLLDPDPAVRRAAADRARTAPQPRGPAAAVAVVPAAHAAGRAELERLLAGVAARLPTRDAAAAALAEEVVLVAGDDGAGERLESEAGRAIAAAVDGPVGLARCTDPPEGLAAAAGRARVALLVAGAVPGWERVGRWADLGAHQVTAQLPPAQLAMALHPAVRRLLDAGEADLLDTLEAYLDTAMRAARATARLHVAKGTLYQRLRRVADLTGLDLEDDHDRLAVHLSLKARHLLGGR